MVYWLLGLAWADVDNDEKLIHIRRQLRRQRIPVEDQTPGGRRTRLVLKDLNTKRSRRTLPLTDELEALLKAHRSRQARERLKLGSTWEDSGRKP